MTNPKGTRWETRLVRWFNDNGFPYVERRARAGKNDRGDLSGLVGITVEAKNAKRVELAQWIDEALVEQNNTHDPFGVVIFPRRNCETGRAFVVMELDQFARLVK